MEGTNKKMPPSFTKEFLEKRAKEEHGAVPDFSTWKEKLEKPFKPIPWVVDKLLVTGTPTLIYGEGGVGKSWFAAHIAASVVTGIDVHGEFSVEQMGNVLWYDNENGEDENDRRTQLLIGDDYKASEHDVYMRETPKFHFIGDEKGFEQMREDIQELSPKLCIVDSMISTLDGEMDENSAKDVRKLIDGIIATTKNIENPPAFLFIHHSKKPSDSSVNEWPDFRGSSDFQNAVGFLIAMRSRTDGDQDYVQFRWNKSRRGRMPKEVYEYSLQDKTRENKENPLNVREYVEYVPSEAPKSPYDELVEITEDVLRKQGRTLPEAVLLPLMGERFTKPPTSSYLKNFLYRLSVDDESNITRKRDENSKASLKFIYQLTII